MKAKRTWKRDDSSDFMDLDAAVESGEKLETRCATFELVTE